MARTFLAKMVMVVVVLIAATSTSVASAWGGNLRGGSGGCVNPEPAANYVNEMYEGRWYEIGRIQTAGGAAFQKDCWCDTTDFHSDTPLVGDGQATYSCRKHGTDGELQAATADLFHDGVPGKFKQQFQYPLAPKLDYTVVYIDQNVAMEYDCSTTLGITNYCVHIMSRQPSIDNTTLNFMLDYAEDLGLNTHNISYKATKQEGCW